MISFIKGTVHNIAENTIIIENNNIGYKIYVANKVCSDVYKGQDIYIHTYMNVKEDGMFLYGFLHIAELEVFEKLITISGVGPKSAISLLDAMPPSDIIRAIISSDIAVLCNGQGIGKKTAQRIVLELKDKLDIADAIPFLDENSINNIEKTENMSETMEALSTLGFGRQEILKALSEIEDKDIPTSKAISLALKKLGS